MDSLAAFAMGQANRGNPTRVFDWHKAARLIRDTKPSMASAGLSGDWEWTGGSIFRDGEPIPEDDTYVYLASTWAIPELCLDGMDGEHTIDCWVWAEDTDDWDSGTYWPESALAILRGQADE